MLDPDLSGGTFVHGAQRPLAAVRLYEDDGHAETTVTLTLVLPNCILFMYPGQDGLMLGQSRFVSPTFARQFADELQDVIDHVTECECPLHAGRAMERLDPAGELA